MTRALLAAATLACACAHPGGATPVTVPVTAAALGRAARVAAPPAARPTDVGTALGRAPGESFFLMRPSLLRDRPALRPIGRLFARWPGWGATLGALAPDPVGDLDWIVVVGPPKAAEQRMMARARVDDATLDGRIAAVAAASTENAADVPGAPASAAVAKLDDVLRLVARTRPHVVAVVSRDDASTARGKSALGSDAISEPSTDPHEAVRVEVVDPGSGDGSPLPYGLRGATLRVLLREDGGADADANLACDDAETAAHLVDTVEDARRRYGAMVNLLTNDVLDGLTVGADGPSVTLRLSASKQQLEATVALASAFASASGGGPP